MFSLSVESDFIEVFRVSLISFFFPFFSGLLLQLWQFQTATPNSKQRRAKIGGWKRTIGTIKRHKPKNRKIHRCAVFYLGTGLGRGPAKTLKASGPCWILLLTQWKCHSRHNWQKNNEKLDRCEYSLIYWGCTLPTVIGWSRRQKEKVRWCYCKGKQLKEALWTSSPYRKHWPSTGCAIKLVGNMYWAFFRIHDILY